MKEKISKAYLDGFFNAEGIHLIGISGISDLSTLSGEFSPEKILKNAVSVICYAMPIPRGVIHAQNHANALYGRYCNTTYRCIDIITNKLTLMLEQSGYPSVPVYGSYPWIIREKNFCGLLPLVYLAESTGIGALTRSGLLSCSEYGTSVLLGGVMTAAELEPTGRSSYRPCPETCRICMDACPTDAISTVGKVDHNLCIRYAHQNPLIWNLLQHPGIKEQFSFETVMNTVGVEDHGTYRCFECIRACPLNSTERITSVGNNG